MPTQRPPLVFAQRYYPDGAPIALGSPSYRHTPQEWFSYCPTCDTLTAHPSRTDAETWVQTHPSPCPTPTTITTTPTRRDLREDQIHRITARLLEGDTPTMIAEDEGITTTMFQQILKGRLRTLRTAARLQLVDAHPPRTVEEFDRLAAELGVRPCSLVGWMRQHNRSHLIPKGAQTNVRTHDSHR